MRAVHAPGDDAAGSSLLSVLRVWIAVGARTYAVLGCLIAIVCCASSVLGGQRAMLGRFRADLGGTLALLGSGHRDVDAAERARVVGLHALAVALHQRQVARIGGLISLCRRGVTCTGDPVTRVGALQTSLGSLITVIAGPIALVGRVLAQVLAAVVLTCVTAGGEVAVTGRLI